MTIASIAGRGVGAHATSASSFTMTTTAQVSAGRRLVLVVVTDNIGTTSTTGSGGFSGATTFPLSSANVTNEHTSVTVAGAGNTWTKIAEFCNAQGSAGAGCTTSIWFINVATTISSGATITMNLSGSCVDKTSSLHEFSSDFPLKVAPNNQIWLTSGTSTGFGNNTINGVPTNGVNYLYFDGFGKELNSTTQITANFTVGSPVAIAVSRSRNNSSAVIVRGAFTIATEGSDQPHGATETNSGDWGAVITHLFEQVYGSLAATGSGSDTFAANDDPVPVSGSMAAGESGADAFASSGTVLLDGPLAATESGADAAAIAGDVIVQGALAGTGGSADAFAVVGDVIVSGALAGSGGSADAFAASGEVTAGAITGSAAATESGADTAAVSGGVIVQGALAAQESGADTVLVPGTVQVRGSLAATDATDTAAVAGAVRIAGAAAVTESGMDAADVAGGVAVQGALAATETGADVAVIAGPDIASGALAADEAGADVTQMIATVIVAGVLAAIESGSDQAQMRSTGQNASAFLAFF